MCGIVGWVDLKNDISCVSYIVGIMSKTLSKRGPDASGLWARNHALIGHTRLTVVDPIGGGQPMIKVRGDSTYVISYNGELYNTDELRSELMSLGHTFSSNSDTEVLLTSYIEWGEGCTGHLNGIFAFAVWDEKKETLFLARDRFGVKPLFYTVKGSSFIFASELKAILMHPHISPRVDSEGLSEVFVLGPSRTPGYGVFKDIFEIKQGHSCIFNHNGIYHTCYWKLNREPHVDSLDETVIKVRDLVIDSVVRQLVADVPVCTFLSGGLDSSIITSIAAGEFRRSGKGRLRTYSIDYVDNDKFFRASSFQPNSDDVWVRRVSETFDTVHSLIKLDVPEVANALGSAVEARDLPGMADIDSSLYLFCREVKKDVVVSLSGECADEYGYSNTCLNNSNF